MGGLIIPDGVDRQAWADASESGRRLYLLLREHPERWTRDGEHLYNAQDRVGVSNPEKRPLLSAWSGDALDYNNRDLIQPCLQVFRFPADVRLVWAAAKLAKLT